MKTPIEIDDIVSAAGGAAHAVYAFNLNDADLGSQCAWEAIAAFAAGIHKSIEAPTSFSTEELAQAMWDEFKERIKSE